MSICGRCLLFERMGIAKVSLGVSLISTLAHTQLCMKQLQMWTLLTIIGIAFGGAMGAYCYTVFGALSRHKRALFLNGLPES